MIASSIEHNRDGQEVSLEGEITHHGLAEILQFLEGGLKSGLLNLEDQKPVGLIQFERGRITFAHTYYEEGYEAVLEILSMKNGRFRFHPGKELLERNCRLNVTHVLLIWATRMDELQHIVSHS